MTATPVATGAPPTSSASPPPTAGWVGAPPPWTPPPAPAAPRRSRAPLYAAVGVVAVVIVLLLSLAALGVLPWFQNNSSSALSFSQARTAAQAAANNYPGGPWSLAIAAGAIPSATLSVPINSTAGNLSGSASSGGCAFSPLTNSTLSVGGSGNVSAGLSNEWVFLFKSSAGGALFVSDNAGAVQLVGTLAGSVCASVFGEITAIPSNAVDSTAAAATVDAAGGYAFLRAHPHANATMEVIGGVSLFGFTAVPAEWVVSYSTCPINLGGGLTSSATGSEFVANVSLTTGALLGANSGTCGGGLGPPPSTLPAISSNLVLGSVAESTAGPTHWYNDSVVYSSGTLTFIDLQFSVQTPSGTTVTLASPTLEFQTTGGVVVASYDLSTGVWLTGSAATIQSGETLVLSSTTALAGAGDSLVISGTSGLATGTISVGIP